MNCWDLSRISFSKLKFHKDMINSIEKAAEGSTIFKRIFGAENKDSSALSWKTAQEISMELLSVESEYWNVLSLMDKEKSVLLLKIEAAEEISKDTLKEDLNKLDKSIEEYTSKKQVFISCLK